MGYKGYGNIPETLFECITFLVKVCRYVSFQLLFE